MYTKNLDLFFLTETWLNSNIIDSNFCPLGYSVIRKDRVGRGGGVAVIFKNFLNLIEVKTNFVSSDGFEFLCFDLILKKLKLRFLCVYIPPSSSKSLVIVSNMIDLIRHLIPKQSPFYILGDFNLPNIDWNISSTTYNDCHKCFIKFCSENLFTQLIDSSTHKNGNILDLLLCNYMALDRIKFHLVDSPITNINDHNVILFGISVHKNKKPSSKSLYPDFRRANFEKINEFLSEINWNALFNNSKNLQMFYDEFIKTIIFSIKQYVPLIKQKKKMKTYPSDIKKLLSEKLKLYKQCKLNKQMVQKYKNVSKKYQKAVKMFNIEHEKSFCQNTNSKKFYTFVKSKLKLTPSIPVLLNENNFPIVSEFDKASFFNRSFQKVFIKDCDDKNFKLVQKKCLEMKNFFIGNDEIIKSVNHLKDKIIRTPENIPSYFIKRTVHSLVLPISLIFNCSLATSSVPNQWKVSYVIPVHKKGSKYNPLNYRPISLTSSFCRIFEHIISLKILDHLFSNKLISHKQFGFLPNRSSCHQLLNCLHSWLVSFLSNKSTKVIYTDIQKAFDSVSHSKLIKTLTQYRIHKSLVSWFKEFLDNRTQKVVIGNSFSESLPVFSGVPQGGVIGPLLFLIYINDIALEVDVDSNINLFADDTKIFSHSDTILQKSLDKIYHWLKERKLDLNPSKCQVLNIQKSTSCITPDFRINNITLPSTKVFKDLGIFIDENLKWNHHINYVYKIASTISYQVLKSFKSTDINTLKKIYLIYIRPKLEYNSPIWSPYLKKDINHLESIQRKYTRTVFNRCNISYTSYFDRLSKLGIKSLEYRRIEFDLITFFKLINCETTFNLQSIFEPYKSTYLLRGNNRKFRCRQNFNNNVWHNSFFYRSVELWNKLPDELVSCKKVEHFRLRLKKFDLNKYFVSKIYK